MNDVIYHIISGFHLEDGRIFHFRHAFVQILSIMDDQIFFMLFSIIPWEGCDKCYYLFLKIGSLHLLARLCSINSPGLFNILLRNGQAIQAAI